MKITAIVQDKNHEAIGLQVPLAKRRGGPDILLGADELWQAHLPYSDLVIPLIVRLPVDAVDRDRAIVALSEEAHIVWGAKLAQQLTLPLG